MKFFIHSSKYFSSYFILKSFVFIPYTIWHRWQFDVGFCVYCASSIQSILVTLTVAESCQDLKDEFIWINSHISCIFYSKNPNKIHPYILNNTSFHFDQLKDHVVIFSLELHILQFLVHISFHQEMAYILVDIRNINKSHMKHILQNDNYDI